MGGMLKPEAEDHSGYHRCQNGQDTEATVFSLTKTKTQEGKTFPGMISLEVRATMETWIHPAGIGSSACRWCNAAGKSSQVTITVLHLCVSERTNRNIR